MPQSCLKVSDSLYLVRVLADAAPPAKPVEVPTDHVAVIDCSGSMTWDLPKIREQLKKKLPKLLREKDTVSIIWFSGRGQFGTLLEAEPVATLSDLKDVERAIDRWLTPNGLTGFKEPLEEAAALVGRLTKKSSGRAASLFFMSDGCDNQWGRSDILKAAEKAASGLAFATFVEYGYYADRGLLSAMAEKAGGSLIFAEDFDRFAPSLEAAVQRKLSGAPRVQVKIPGDVVGGFAFSLVPGDGSLGDIVAYGLESGAVSVPQDVGSVWYLSPTPVGSPVSPASGRLTDLPYFSDAAYAAVSLFAQRMKSDVVLSLLKLSGDVSFIDKFSTCFGKQKYSEFVDMARFAAFNPGSRLSFGYDPARVPPDDAFTVLDLLRILADDDGNRVLLDHPEFRYSRIGRGRVDSSEVLSEEEQKEVDDLTAKMATEKNAKKLSEYAARVASITVGKEALRFEADPAPDGYPISNLTWNEDRPNVSILVKKPGAVDVSPRLPDTLIGKVPARFETFVYRNYTIIKDGLVNVQKLPVRPTVGTIEKLIAAGLSCSLGQDGSVVLDLTALPVINRKMVKSVSARDFFGKKYELTKLQAAQKVYNSFSKELIPDAKLAGFAERYGEEAATWLKEQGFSEGSGFSPKSVQAPSTDYYVGKKLKTSLKGLSSLPSLKELREKVAKGKLNPPSQLMKPALDEVEAFLASPSYAKAADQPAVLKAWLGGQANAQRSRVRGLIYDLAQVTFCLIVGQVWFSEFSTLEENELTLKADGQDILCKAEMEDVEIKI